MVNYIISCDWGTSSFRLRLLQLNTRVVLAESKTGAGIAAVNAAWLATGRPPAERMNYFRAALQAAVGAIDNDHVKGSPIFLSGMASSSIGMKALDYGTLPFDLATVNLPYEKISADTICSHDIFLFSGLRSDDDVLRGEETILLGSQFENQKDCLLIFPGTHSKHVWVRQNMLVNFSTFMTGEIFEMLASKTVLSASLQSSLIKDYESIFRLAVADSIKGNLLNTAFHVRTNQLFNKLTPAENFQYLSGLVIGTELKELKDSEIDIVLVSGAGLTSGYLMALDTLGFSSRVQSLDADQALINGHIKLALSLLKGQH